MRFDELIQKVVRSTPDDWVELAPPIWPLYLDYGTGPNGEWIRVREHSSGWVLREDVQVQLAYGLDPDRDLYFDWKFPDPKIVGRKFEIKFNGQPIFRDTLLTVDGGRAILPIPASETVQAENTMALVGYSANSQEIALARLIDELVGHREFDRYLKQAGILEMESPDR